MSSKMSVTAGELLNDYNGLLYVINRVIRNNVNTCDIMKVVAVNADNTIDVIPVIRDSDANGEPIENSNIYGIRYFEWQFGENLISAKPEVGDIGLVLACKKDISKIDTELIGSYRKYSYADGIYIGGIKGLGKEVKQSLVFDENGITITTDKDITVNAVNSVVNTETSILNTNESTVNASVSATINAPEVFVGGDSSTALKKIAKDGDEVYAGQTLVGTIKAADDTVVKTL